MIPKQDRESPPEVEVTVAMVAAFQRAFFEWEKGSRSHSWRRGIGLILGALLQDAPDDTKTVIRGEIPKDTSQ